MVDVRRVIACWQTTRSARAAARHLGIDRKTVRRYVAAALALGLGEKRALSDDDLESVLRQTRALAPPRAAWDVLRAQRDAFAPPDDAAPPPSLRRVQARLAERGVRVAYSTLRRFALRELGWKRSASNPSTPDYLEGPPRALGRNLAKPPAIV